MKKKERDHLKEDPFINFFHGAMDFLRRFKREFTIAAAIVLVALILLVVGILLRSHSLAVENRLYSESLQIINTDTLTNSEKITRLKELQPRKGVSAAVGIYLASLYFEEGNLEKAKTVLDEMPNSRIQIINDQRQLLTADILSGLGQERQALEILSKLLSDNRSKLARDYILLKLARLQIRNEQTEDAVESLNRLIAQFQGSFYLSEAEMLLEQLQSGS